MTRTNAPVTYHYHRTALQFGEADIDGKDFSGQVSTLLSYAVTVGNLPIYTKSSYTHLTYPVPMPFS